MSAQQGEFTFASFTLNLARGELMRDGHAVSLRPKSFDVLTHLLQHHGRLIPKNELMDAVWGNTVVTDDSLTQCIIDIRKALGDKRQHIVRTVPRRGYILDVAVHFVGVPDGASGQSAFDGSVGVLDGTRETVGVPVAAPHGGSVSEGSVGALVGGPPGGGSAGRAPGSTGTPTVPSLPVSADRERVGWPATALLILLVGAASLWWLMGKVGQPPSPGSVTPAQPRANSIAVLPFADLSPEKDQQYFADGLAEELLHVLAQSPDLLVIARTSSFAAQGNIAAIASALNVAFVLEGSVRKSDEQLRVTAQLIDTATSAHVWSHTYERTLDDIFAIQNSIADAVARELHASLSPTVPANYGSTTNTQAHDLFQRAQFLYNRRAPDDLANALQLYEDALALDPGFGRAWVGVAAIHNLYRIEPELHEPGLTPEHIAKRHRDAIERALAVAPDLAETQMRAAHYFLASSEPSDWPAARRHFEKAVSLGPNNPLILGVQVGQLLGKGLTDEAIEVQLKVVALEPLSFAARYNLAIHLTYGKRFETALRAVRNAAQLGPSMRQGPGRLEVLQVLEADLLILLGRFDEATAKVRGWPFGFDRERAFAMIHFAKGNADESVAAREQMIKASTADSYDSLLIAEVLAFSGATQPALEWLGILGESRVCRTNLLHIWYSPFLARMDSGPAVTRHRERIRKRMEECIQRLEPEFASMDHATRPPARRHTE